MLLTQVLTSLVDSRRPSVPRQLLYIYRDSIYIHNMLLIYIITPHTASRGDWEQGFELAKCPRQHPEMHSWLKPGGTEPRAGKRADSGSLRHLLAGSVASLAAKKESVQGRGLVDPICTAEAKDPGSDSSSSLRAKKF